MNYYLDGFKYTTLIFLLITSVFFWIRYTDKNYNNKLEDITEEIDFISADSAYAELYEYDDAYLNLNLLVPATNVSTLYI